MSLTRDPSCMRDMLWRIQLEGADLREIAGKLEADGWVDRSRLPLLVDLHGPEGHALVMVPRTGRVQLRLHYLTPAEVRPGAAEGVYRRVVGLSR